MIVFQKCVVMPTIVGGYWGALLTLRLISWKRKTWLFQPNNKIKISVQQIIFINFGKSVKNAPLMNIPSPSLVPSTPKVTGCHRIYARYISLSSIHSVCIMLFILSPLIRWSHIKCCALLRVFLLTTNWQLSLNYFASTLLHHQPHSGIFINDLNIMPFFILNEEAFLSKYSTFFYDVKENSWWQYNCFEVFNTYQIYHAPPYIANTIRFANTQIFSQF